MHEACVVLVMKTNLSRCVQTFCSTLQTVRPNRPNNYSLELLYSLDLTMHGSNNTSLAFSMVSSKQATFIMTSRSIDIHLPSESCLAFVAFWQQEQMAWVPSPWRMLANSVTRWCVLAQGLILAKA